MRPIDEMIIEMLNKVASNIKELAEVIIKFGQNIVAIFTPFMEQATRAMLILSTDNKRILCLALYHPKARVRKKNINRILREMRRQCEL